jgi:hypothetical protein
MAITTSTQVQKAKGSVILSFLPSAALGALAVGVTNIDFSAPDLRVGDKVVGGWLNTIDANISVSGAQVLTAAAGDSTGGQIRVQLLNRSGGAVAITGDPVEVLVEVMRV